ncbi:isochorismatase family protein [Roseococcus sp. YIM B11640]|uniref:isochorismatase family protein n=1 Tax=Roseococcus sp. YIM B11640 TaxID=3133973 RepID=UPI003C7C3D6C
MGQDIYAARGYGSREIGFGEKPGLVVIDFQIGFTDPAYPLGGAPMVERAVENTARVMRVAKQAGIPIIACVVAFDGPRGAPHWKIESVFDMQAGNPATRLDPRIAAEEPDVVMSKTAPSIFFGTAAGAILTRERVDTVIVTGCITSGCVRASIVDAFSLGFRVQVPEDCVGDQDRVAHEQNLTDVGRRYADIIDADRAIAAIQAWSRRNSAG